MIRAVMVALTVLACPAYAQNSLRSPIELLPLPPPAPLTVTNGNGTRFTPAPVPNRNATLPAGPRVRRPNTELSPSVITRSDQYRGDGFSAGSTAQSEQEKRARPGAGVNLRMPFQPEK